MTVTESSSGLRLDVTRREFERRLAARGHDAHEIDRLWDALAVDREPPRGRVLGLGPVIAVYVGLLLISMACVSLLVIYWSDLGAWAILAFAVTYLTGYLVASEILRRRRLTQPADVLEAVAVGWAGLATYAVQELAGVWPDGASDSDEVHRGITVIAIVCLATAALLLALRPDALLLVPIAAATVVLAVDVSEVVFGRRIDDLDERQLTVLVLPVGVAWIVTGLWLDATRRRGFATWAYWCGLLTTGVAVVSMIPKTVPGFALVGVLGAIALFFSAFVRHWSFTVVGALGLLMATTSAMGELGGFAPVVIALVGIALVVVGLRWSRWRESIRTATLTRMPLGARRLVQRLAP
jgi:hypothetical protein